MLLLITGIGVAGAQDKPAYSLFDEKGVKVGYEDLIERLSLSDVVFIGEIHNCPIAHWLEFEITKSLYSIHKSDLAMGAEMFESDNQLILDEYMSGLISSERFEAEARLWDNYSTDYEPFVYFAKEHSIPFSATNVPRRYAAMVKEHGMASLVKLSEEAKTYLPPLPIVFEYNEEEAQAYEMMAAMRGNKVDYRQYAEAQALKDATMAWFISQNLKHNFIHINGNFHTDFGKGIIPYLKRYRPDAKIVTIATVRQEEIDKLEEENIGRADFYICVPEDMTFSY